MMNVKKIRILFIVMVITMISIAACACNRNGKKKKQKNQIRQYHPGRRQPGAGTVHAERAVYEH